MGYWGDKTLPAEAPTPTPTPPKRKPGSYWDQPGLSAAPAEEDIANQNLISRGLEILGRPSAASAGFAYGLASGEDPFEKARLGLTGEQRYNYADVLGKMGLEEGIPRNVLGFIGDVALDPTMWIPGVGVVSAAKIGGKAGTVLRAAEKAQALPFEMIGKGVRAAMGIGGEGIRLVTPEIPTITGLIETQTANQATRLGSAGAKLRNIPGAKAILDRLTGPTQFSGDVVGSLERLKKGVDAHQAGREPWVSVVTAPIRAMRDPYQVVDQDGVRLASNVIVKKPGASLALGDIMEHPDWYNLTPEQLAYRNQAVAINKTLWEYGQKRGLDLTDLGMEEGDVFPRFVLGRAPDGTVEVISTRRTGTAVGAAENQLKKHRFYETQLEGMQAKLLYEEDAGAILSRLARNIYSGVGDKELSTIVKGMVGGIRSPKTPALLKEAVEDSKTFYEAITNLEQAVQRARRGEILPASVIAAAKFRFPTLGQELDDLVKAAQMQRQKISGLRPGQPEELGRLVADERMAAEQVLEEAYSERDVLKEVLANDPVANYTWGESYTRRVGGELKTFTRQMGLDSIIPKSGAFKGQWPESVTQKQAENLMMGRKPSPSSIRPDGRVKWEYVMAELTQHFGMADKDELIAAIEKVAETKAQLAELPAQIKGLEARYKELTDLSDRLGGAPTQGQVSGHAQGLKQLLEQVRDTKAATKDMLAEARQQAKLGRERSGVIRPGLEIGLTPRAFGGSIAPIKEGEAINRLFGPQQTNQVLQGLSSVTNAVRMFQTGFDLGGGMIQLLPIMFRRPDLWVKAQKLGFEALVDPTVWPRFQVEHAAVYERLVPTGMLAGGAHETTEAMRQVGRVGRLFQEGPLSKVAVPAGRKFEVELEAARVMLGESLLPLADRDIQKLVAKGMSQEAAQRQIDGQLAGFLNKITGVFSSQALGISSTQRQVEAAVLFFSPRYLRATFALLGDIANGGLAGREAMKSLGAMMAGGLISYQSMARALGQQANLDPREGKFLTLKLGDTNVGPGSGWVALARAAGNIAKAVETPSNFALGGLIAGKQDWRDILETDPFWRYWRGRAAPLTGNFLDILTNETVIGDPVQSPEDFLRVVVARDLAPFWLAEMVQPGPEAGIVEQPMSAEGRALNVAAGLTGLRAWPVSEAETRNNLRENYSKLTYGKEWTGLTRSEKDVLEQAHDDLRAATQTAQVEIVRRGGPRAIYEGLTKQIENTKLVRGQELDKAAKAVIVGQMAYADYAKVREESMTKYGNQTEMLYQQREAAAKDVPQFQQKDLERTEELDARDRYYQISLDQFRDATGQITDDSWSAFEAAQKRFLNTLTPTLRKYVVEHEGDWIQALPPAARRIETQRKADYALLEQYWQIADDAWKSVPTLAAMKKRVESEQNPIQRIGLQKMANAQGLQIVEKIISARKDALRYTNPAVDAALYRWGYVSKPITLRGL